jgi:hypothetical protein
VAMLRGLKETFGPIIERFGAMNIAGAALAAFFGGPLVAAVASLVASIVTLSIALAATPFGWVVLAVVGITAAVTALVLSWDSVTAAVKNFWQWVTRPLPEWLRKLLNADFTPNAGQTGGDLQARANNVMAEFAGQRSEAHVVVDFNNVPRGVRVNNDTRGGASVDLSLGYTMQDALGVSP